MIKLLQITILVLLLASSGQAKINDIKKCPSYCSCDLFEGLNRADCSNQRLISANVEVPYAAEVLDLSYNDITTLDNACFEGLIYVVNVTIAHNALHTIYLDAFSPLKNVKSIDLSFNRLEYFDERIFETNTKLTRLNLSGNKFMSLRNKNFIKTTSLLYLDLHDAQITYIYSLMFGEVPRLRVLDISNNLMITLNAIAFNALHQLETIDLEGNRWVCDKSFYATLALLKARGVETKQSSCIKTEIARRRGPSAQMFERMMAASPPLDPEIQEATSVEDIWNPKQIETESENSTCDNTNSDEKCRLIRNCLTRLDILTKEKSTRPYRYQFTESDVYFVFFLGILTGIASVICISSCVVCVRNVCKSNKELLPRRSETPPPCVNGTFRSMPPVPVQRPIYPPPVPLRQRRSNRRSRNAPSTNLSLSTTRRTAVGSRSGFANFLTQIFERPSRHQYYRTINENTAHMIRRLSQSNLFNNRLSQHFTGARSNEGDQNSGIQQEPLLQSQSSETSQTNSVMTPISDQAQVHCSIRERWQIAAQQRPPSAPQIRPETPPPSYGDLIDIKRVV